MKTQNQKDFDILGVNTNELGKSVLTFISLMMLLFLAACGNGNETTSGGEGSGDNKTIGVSMSNLDEFLTYMQDAMQEEAENHPDFEFIYSDAQDDSSRQLDQIENFITRNVDAIIINPVDSTSVVDIINNAEIPVIVVNCTFEGIEAATAYVGSESIQAGTLQMEEVAKLLDGEGNIAIMTGILGLENQIKRTEGNVQIIEI